MFRTYGSTLKTLFIILWMIVGFMAVVKGFQAVDRMQAQVVQQLP